MEDHTLDTPRHPNPATVSNNPLALRYGLLWAGASIIITLIGFLTGHDPNMPTTGTGVKVLFGLLSLGVAVWAVVTAIKTDRDVQLGGSLTLGRALGLGSKTGLVSGLVSGLFTVLYMTVINRDFADRFKENMMAEYERQGMSEEQMEMAMGIASKMMSPAVIGVSAIFSAIITGLLIGLIAGAIMKRE
jgi:hypothetical protein